MGRLLNYTTQIAVEKTLLEIQKILLSAGAKEFHSEYGDDGALASMSFAIVTIKGKVGFRLPANVDGVHKLLMSAKGIPSKHRTRDQAVRTSWRILKNWVEAQSAIVQVGLAEITEVFLPYVIRPSGNTFYQEIKNDGMKLLT